MTKALVVLSGGQDSTTALYCALHNYEEVAAITFEYGQRHAIEALSASHIVKMAGIKDHLITEIGNTVLESTSPLVDAAQPLEQYADFETMQKTIGSRVEKTFVPMRNALFLTLAANRAVAIGANVIVTGICQADGTNYPDCTEQFIIRMEQMINTALGTHVAEDSGDNYLRIATPLLRRTKVESIKFALRFPGCYKALAYSHTAYDGSYPPSGKDHATVLRSWGFVQANIPDPIYVRAYLEGRIDRLPATTNYHPFELSLADCRSKITVSSIDDDKETMISTMLTDMEALLRAKHIDMSDRCESLR